MAKDPKLEWMFKILDSICRTKKPLHIDDIEKYYNGAYMLLRWISFSKITDAERKMLLPYINSIPWGVFPDKYSEYLYLMNILPKFGRNKYNYIKKKPKEKPLDTGESEPDKQRIIDFLAESLEISKNEATYFVDNGYVDIIKLNKMI